MLHSTSAVNCYDSVVLKLRWTGTAPHESLDVSPTKPLGLSLTYSTGKSSSTIVCLAFVSTLRYAIECEEAVRCVGQAKITCSRVWV